MILLKNLANFDIVLASQSPRRKELLQGLAIDFRTELLEVDENYPESLRAEEIPLFLAAKKAEAYQTILKDNTLIITADTIVWHNNKVLNKPQNEEEAYQMLSALSGKTHEVITGVSIMDKRKQKTFSVSTEVRFAKITDEEIKFYIENYRPYDKAGAYGIQEWIGFIGVEHINGSYFNVMGLPIQRLYTELKQW